MHLYALSFCLGQTFKNIIETPLTTLIKEWHAISRSQRMDKTIVFRATEADRAAVKLAAQQRGMDCSGLIRQLLIKEKILTPTGGENETNF